MGSFLNASSGTKEFEKGRLQGKGEGMKRVINDRELKAFTCITVFRNKNFTTVHVCNTI